jgi:hypothetical protein
MFIYEADMSDSVVFFISISLGYIIWTQFSDAKDAYENLHSFRKEYLGALYQSPLQSYPSLLSQIPLQLAHVKIFYAI